MAKVALAVAIENEINNSNGMITRNEGGKFNLPVRNMDFGDPYEEGDVITIPENFDILNIVIDENRKGADGKPISTPFIMVEVVNEKTGAEKNMRFFPNQLAKVVFPVDENGKRLPKVKTTGTAAKHFATFQDVDAAMDDLKGKKIAITKDDTYQTLRYGTTDIVRTHVYQYDLV